MLRGVPSASNHDCKVIKMWPYEWPTGSNLGTNEARRSSCRSSQTDVGSMTSLE